MKNTRKNFKMIILLILMMLVTFALTSCQKNSDEKNIDKEENIIIEKPKNIKIDTGEWNLLLVDVNNKLPEDFTVKTGVIPPQYIVNSDADEVDERILDLLLKMLDDAEKEGFKIRITSAYRDLEYQQNLFSSQIQKGIDSGLSQEEAEKQAAEYIALPGTSEHNTGLAIDLVSQDWFEENDNLYATFEQTEEAQWLFDNSYKYGFILSFPKNKVNITKISYEPWHYRYVGIEHAEVINEKDYVLQEYLYYY